MTIKRVLIFLGTIAVLLGAAAVVAVFYNPSISVIPGTASPSSTSLFSLTKGTSGIAAAGNTTGNAANAFFGNAAQGTSSSAENASGTPQFASTYAWPYPLQWTEGSSTLAVAGAAIEGNLLVLAVVAHTGNQQECVPMNASIIIDESGAMESSTPSQFSFPDTRSCNGTPDTTYNAQNFSFALTPSMQAPFLLTTGGTSNIFFEVATTTDDGVSITLPATTD